MCFDSIYDLIVYYKVREVGEEGKEEGGGQSSGGGRGGGGGREEWIE